MTIKLVPRIEGAIVALFSLAWAASAHEAQQCTTEPVRYEAIELGTLGADGGYAQAINDRGQLTGAASVSSDVGRAFIWDCENGMSDIGALTDTDFASSGTFINERGTVIGQSFSETDVQIFIWDRATGMRAIVSGLPLSLNNRNDVTFWSADGLVLWNAATGSVSVNELSGLNFREALVNNWRQLGGYGAPIDPDSTVGFYIWGPRRGARLLAESTFAQNAVYDFNDRGELLVNNFTGTRTVPSIVKPDGSVQLLGTGATNTFTEARAFNNRGQVVGFRFTAEQPEQKPFVWTAEQGFRDLNLLVPGHPPTDADTSVVSANDINDWGWIAASVLAPGARYSNPALLVPMPANMHFDRDLSRLRGPQLCHALQTLKVRALLQARTCH